MVLSNVSLIRNAAFDPSFQFRNDVCSLLYTSIEVGQPAEILRGSKPYFMAFSQEITLFFFFSPRSQRALQEAVAPQVFVWTWDT